METIYRVNRNKAEAPLYAIFAAAAFMCSLVLLKLMPDTEFISNFWWIFILANFAVFGLALWVLRSRNIAPFNKQYYVKVDDLGIEYRLHAFSKPTVLLWQYIGRVTFQMYEINMKLSESKTTASLQMGYLYEEDLESLKDHIRKNTQGNSGLN